VTDLAPAGTEVTDTPPPPQTPPVEEPSPTIQTEVSPRPKPKPAPRVAPAPSEAPAPDAQVSDTAVAETTPTPSDTQTPEKPKTAEAPPESGDVLLTEANKDQTDAASSAPLTSGRPKARPMKLAAAAEPAPAATQTASADTSATDAAVNDALAEALSGAASDTPTPGTGTAASGPPLTGGEKDGMLHAVSQCWNLGSASSEVLNTIVTVQFDLDQNAKPIDGTIKLAGSSGGSDDAAKRGFEIARRAILRCGAKGFPLPAEKYETWRQMEISFDPSQMRLR
jgi:hypothetical protein